jgi:hypothetical protein
MHVHEKYGLPYNNFHGSHEWSRGANIDKVQHAASHIQQSAVPCAMLPIITNKAVSLALRDAPHHYQQGNGHPVTAV